MMKWGTLLKDLKDRVGLTRQQPPPSSSASSPTSCGANASSALSPTSRDSHELELDLEKSWEEFRSSSSEKEKEAALNLCVDIFCRLVKEQAKVTQLVTKAFVTDREKLKASSKKRSLDVAQVLEYFSEATNDDISTGANLLTALEILVSGPIDKQSLLDSGIFCCLVHILNALLDPDTTLQQLNTAIDHEGPLVLQKGYNGNVGDCLAMINTSQLPSDSILSVTSSTFSDWLDMKWHATGHQSGVVKVWQMVHCSAPNSLGRSTSDGIGGSNLGAEELENKLILRKVLKLNEHPVTAPFTSPVTSNSC